MHIKGELYMIKKTSILILAAVLLVLSGNAFASQAISVIYLTTDKGQGEEIGTVIFKDTKEGIKVSYDLKDLTPGNHGFHIHEHPDCSPVLKDGKYEHAMAAGGHYDPKHTGKHLGPDGEGHKGDLPLLVVSEDGTAIGNFTLSKAKGLNVAEIKNRSLIIHEGSDNYSDTPVALGGGSARIACGVIEEITKAK